MKQGETFICDGCLSKTTDQTFVDFHWITSEVRNEHYCNHCHYINEEGMVEIIDNDGIKDQSESPKAEPQEQQF